MKRVILQLMLLCCSLVQILSGQQITQPSANLRVFETAVWPEGAPCDLDGSLGHPLLMEVVQSPPSTSDLERIKALEGHLRGLPVTRGIVATVWAQTAEHRAREVRSLQAYWVAHLPRSPLTVLGGWPVGWPAEPPMPGTLVLVGPLGNLIGQARTPEDRLQLLERLPALDAAARMGVGEDGPLRTARRLAHLEGELGRARRLLATTHTEDYGVAEAHHALIRELRTAARMRIDNVRSLLRVGRLREAQAHAVAFRAACAGWPRMEDAASELQAEVKAQVSAQQAVTEELLDRAWLAVLLQGPDRRGLERLERLRGRSGTLPPLEARIERHIALLKHGLTREGD